MRQISILIADDHMLIREAWAMFLNSDERFKIIATCESGEKAIELAKKLRPDVILMDINLPGMNGFEATSQIRKFVPDSKILGVSMHAQPCYVKKMIKVGAMGFVTKNSPAEEMFKAIIEVDKRKKYICREIRQMVATKTFTDTNEQQQKTSWLSFREMEIVDHLKMGYSSKEIGGLLNLSAKTIDVHRYNILRKLKVKNTAALINHVNVAS